MLNQFFKKNGVTTMQQSSTEKKESFKHWYLRHLFDLMIKIIIETFLLNRERNQLYHEDADKFSENILNLP